MILLLTFTFGKLKSNSHWIDSPISDLCGNNTFCSFTGEQEKGIWKLIKRTLRGALILSAVSTGGTVCLCCKNTSQDTLAAAPPVLSMGCRHRVSSSTPCLLPVGAPCCSSQLGCLPSHCINMVAVKKDSKNHSVQLCLIVSYPEQYCGW